MPADNRKFFKYNVEGEYFDEDSGIIKEIIYYPDTKEITFTFLDDSQKTVELANLVANTELATLLAGIIESDTLDISEEDNKINLEIPESYKNCYNITSSDITNITPITENQFSVTLSESLIEVITTFKQNLYMDWENQFPEFLAALAGVKVNNFTPTKKMTFGDNPTIYYVFSAIDSWVADFSIVLYYEDNTWKFMIIHNNLVTQEDLNIALEPLESQIAEKSKVVPNPTLVGDEPALEGAEIDGVKYKVGGGGKLYMHHITGNQNESFTVYTTDNTPFTRATINEFLKKCSPIKLAGEYYPANIKYFWDSLSVFANNFTTKKGFYNNNNVWTEYTTYDFTLLSDTVTEV